MKKYILFLLITFIFTACNKFRDVKTIPKTTIKFEAPHRKYNPIIKGAILNMSYKLFNTGTNPLVISEVQTSCNCVVSKRTTNVIGAGDYGFINLEFDSKKNTGYIKQYITIIANTDAVFSKNITFETNVVPDSHYKKDYEEIYFTEREVNDFSKNYISLEN